MKREFIVNWFAEKGVLTKEELMKDLSVNYFEQGLIDSFAFLELISACEKEYDFKFSDEDFANEDIFTIIGLINCIEKY